MTKKELLEELKNIPDDAVVCIYADYTGKFVELNSIDYIDEEMEYFDSNDIKRKAKLIAI